MLFSDFEAVTIIKVEGGGEKALGQATGSLDVQVSRFRRAPDADWKQRSATLSPLGHFITSRLKAQGPTL